MQGYSLFEEYLIYLNSLCTCLLAAHVCARECAWVRGQIVGVLGIELMSLLWVGGKHLYPLSRVTSLRRSLRERGRSLRQWSPRDLGLGLCPKEGPLS